MSTPKTKGRVNISQKRKASSDLRGPVTEKSLVDLDPEIKAELSKKGLVWRFINAKQYAQNHGFHKSGWLVYKRAVISTESRGSLDFQYGQDPDGYIRRGDLVLAVKSASDQAEHSAKIRAKTARYDQVSKQAAAELRQTGVGKVYEGYDENDDDIEQGDEE